MAVSLNKSAKTSTRHSYSSPLEPAAGKKSVTKASTAMRQYDLVDKVASYDCEVKEALLNKAYVYATKMHGSQLRASGDPYFSHPVEVAGILTELHLDSETIAAALLHDVIEDTKACYGDLEKKFGKKVADLVEGVTKLSRHHWSDSNSAQAENFRKFLVATAMDVRVLLIKLADRLHNMRTLHFIASPEKRKRIAQETLDIYAPLAGRMGIRSFRDEFEDLAFKELYRDAYTALSRQLDKLLAKRSNLVDTVQKELQKLFCREGFHHEGVQGEITGRLKSPFSIWRKMKQRAITLEQLSDIWAFRIIVPDVASCYKILGVLHTTWSMVPGRFKDYVSTPKSNGYRSIHTTIIGPENQRVEIQIRTHKMDEIAKRGIAAHWVYKTEHDGGAVDYDSIEVFQWLRAFVDNLKEGGSAEEFLEHAKLELFHDQVFCFTPKGRLITLPQGATVLDFAYGVHTQLGNHCVGGKINGQQVPLRQKLTSGAEVEILSHKKQLPSLSWESFVITGKARAAIRKSLRESHYKSYVELGESMLRSMINASGHRMRKSALHKVLVALNQKDLPSLYEQIGRGNITCATVLGHLYPTSSSLPAAFDNTKPLPINGLLPGSAITLAHEYFPLPGEAIVGISSPNQGITVYPLWAEALQKYDAHPELWVPLRWEKSTSSQPIFKSRVMVVVANKIGALSSISTAIAECKANILGISIINKDDNFYDLEIDMEVCDLRHLTDIIFALKHLPMISSAERMVAP